MIDQVIHELVGLSHWVVRESGRPLGFEGIERAARAMLDQRDLATDQHLVDYLLIAAMTTHDFVRANSVLSSQVV